MYWRVFKFAFLCLWQNTNQNQLGNKRVLFVCLFFGWHILSQSILEGSLSSNSRQKSGVQNWSREHRGVCFYSLDFYGSLSLLYHTTRTYGWHHPHGPGPPINHSSNKWPTDRPIWWQHFLNWGFLFTNEPSLTKLAKTLASSKNIQENSSALTVVHGKRWKFLCIRN